MALCAFGRVPFRMLLGRCLFRYELCAYRPAGRQGNGICQSDNSSVCVCRDGVPA